MSARKDSCPYGGAVPADSGWLVVQTKRHKERAVQAALAREEIPTYLPLLRQWPRPAVGGGVGPMFPAMYCASPIPAGSASWRLATGAPPRVVRRHPRSRGIGGHRLPAQSRRKRRVIEVNPVVAGHAHAQPGRHAAAPPRFVFALPCDVLPREVAWRRRRPSRPRWMAGHVGMREGAVCAIAGTIDPAGGGGRHAGASRGGVPQSRRTLKSFAPFTTLGASYDGNGS